MVNFAPARLVLVIALVGVAGVIGGTVLEYFVLPPRDSGEPPAEGTDGAQPTLVPSVPADGTPAEGRFPGAPTRINEFGVPVGYPRTEAGAVSACGNYVSAYLRAENREPSRIDDLFRSIGIDSTYAGLAKDIVEADGTTAQNFGVPSINSPEMAFNLRTVGYSVESYSSEEAQISIWSTSSVGVYGGVEETKPRESWGTDICTVQWIENDWRLSEADDGPDNPVLTDRGAEAFQRFVLVGAAS